MYLESFIRKQVLKTNIKECWDFFSNPKNLSVITPREMNFVILTELPEEIYPGLIIQYKVSPLLSIRMDWVTEITQVNKPFFFVDEQRFGPYKFWHHQHIFKEVDGGIEMTDIVHYRIPFGIAGKVFGNWLVKKQLNKIFDYRTQKMFDIFK
ncbi:MAG TPA: SRPBCC family protein [Candidatus Kapabacteria bacterium]|nr:SRPBCC family protein [Candidatus Kapabacteria bacterium]HOM04486.1 SRPBCC family protein [Candidatus Kapabacteria bacterium]HPP40838.1 SRPBCC family protein [Candidatus Kapabacteria bacterium]